jgi:hypothetical protein
MEIEASRAVVEHIALPLEVQPELRRRARLRSTHYSTRIEGNRLTLTEAEQVVEGKRLLLRGRERSSSLKPTICHLPSSPVWRTINSSPSIPITTAMAVRPGSWRRSFCTGAATG